MSFKRPQIHRRDNNHHPLVKIFEAVGGVWLPDGPFDGWGHWRGKWNLIEIKNPDKEGHKNEYTDKQKLLLAKLKKLGIHVPVWRDDEDVMKLIDAEDQRTLRGG